MLAWDRQGLGEALGEARVRLPELLALYIGLVLTTYYIFATRP